VLRKSAIALAVAASAAALTSLPAQAAKPVVTGHETLSHGMVVRGAHAASHGARPTRSSNLTYHGGAVNLTPKVYIVYWGAQWVTSTGAFNDPKNAAAVQREFFNGAGESGWAKSTLQYCTGVSNVLNSSGSCKAAAQPTTGDLVIDTWLDTSVEPQHASQSDLAGEAQRAAARLVNAGTDISNVQFIIDSPSGNSPSGFGTQYCAWHSSTSYAGKPIAYTNMPYVPDAGTACGASFVSSAGTENSNANEGVTIVGGHEWAETVTDEYPNGGWLDSQGAENGDKCAWITTGHPGASGTVTIGTKNFVVQSLWSNSASGCVLTSS